MQQRFEPECTPARFLSLVGTNFTYSHMDDAGIFYLFDEVVPTRLEHDGAFFPIGSVDGFAQVSPTVRLKATIHKAMVNALPSCGMRMTTSISVSLIVLMRRRMSMARRAHTLSAT